MLHWVVDHCRGKIRKEAKTVNISASVVVSGTRGRSESPRPEHGGKEDSAQRNRGFTLQAKDGGGVGRLWVKLLE